MVAALAQENALPIPQLDLSSLASTTSGFGQYPSEIRAPVPTRAYSEDPWNVPKFPSAPAVPANGSLTNGAPSSISGTGLPRDWWKKQETVTVNILGQQGFILNRYLVYEVSTDVSIIASVMSVAAHSCPLIARTSCSSTLLGVCNTLGLLGTKISIQTSSITATQTART